MDRIAEALGKNNTIEYAFLGGNYVSDDAALNFRNLMTKGSLREIVFVHRGIEHYSLSEKGTINVEYTTKIQCHSYLSIAAIAGLGTIGFCLANDGYIYSAKVVSVGGELGIGEGYHQMLVKSDKPLYEFNKKTSWTGKTWGYGWIFGKSGGSFKNKETSTLEWESRGGWNGFRYSWGKLTLKRLEKHSKKSKYGFGNSLYGVEPG